MLVKFLSLNTKFYIPDGETLLMETQWQTKSLIVAQRLSVVTLSRESSNFANYHMFLLPRRLNFISLSTGWFQEQTRDSLSTLYSIKCKFNVTTWDINQTELPYVSTERKLCKMNQQVH